MPQPKSITETYTDELHKTSTITVQYGETEGATKSISSWSNDSLMQGLRIMFRCSEDEIIESVSIDHIGIHATFRRE